MTTVEAIRAALNELGACPRRFEGPNVEPLSPCKGVYIVDPAKWALAAEKRLNRVLQSYQEWKAMPEGNTVLERERKERRLKDLKADVRAIYADALALVDELNRRSQAGAEVANV